MEVLNLENIETSHKVFKALSSKNRLAILTLLHESPKGINELSSLMKLPTSTVSNHIKVLEEADLISTKILTGKGSQKLSTLKHSKIILDLFNSQTSDNKIDYEIGIGNYSSCYAKPTCGLLNNHGVIHAFDDPKSFYEDNHSSAQLLWFKQGYVEYLLPNRIPYGESAKEISFTCEICSEAPHHNNNYPSDISCWINNVEIGKWRSPGDFGGHKGVLTPDWWDEKDTQFGVLKKWTVNQNGSYIDNIYISPITIQDLNLENGPSIGFKLGVKEDAEYIGGINIFGDNFGNYPQNIIITIKY